MSGSAIVETVNSPSAKIEVVLFDLGGVLVELTGESTMLGWLGNQITLDELWVKWLASPAVRDFERGRISTQLFAGQVIREMSLPVASDEFLLAFTGWVAGLYPGALELVNSLPAGIVRATLANTSVLHWPRLMNELSLERHFHHHFPSHLTGRIKPDQEAFQHVIEALGCRPEAVLFLDDNRLNVATAKTLGMRAACVKGPIEARNALTEAGLLKI
jgi:putative hydrolase of the HAD superfamily